MRYSEHFDVIVIGGGHAGTEAALAPARMGRKTLLLTHNIETLGQMSCNPAIGGIGKGHLVKEIDALGGAMALAADQAGIQFRTLNASKGPAVRATRAQADRQLYRRAIRRRLEAEPNLQVFQQEAADLVIAGERVVGVVTQSGIEFRAHAVVLTVGTFLGGRIHVGLQSHAGGRAGDAPSNHLAAKLRELALRVGRLKTGTPPRIDGRSIDFTDLKAQHSDEPRPVFSYLATRATHPRQLPCHITATNERTHDIIRAASERSPMFTGLIEGVGPRYCPSVEDKVVRFADRLSHQIFIEPEGLDTHEIYPNGISTSLPFDVQFEFVRSIKGFERAHLTRPGYAIEYDFFDPRDLKSQSGEQGRGGFVLRRPDQRHHRLRRGRGPGSAGGHQRRAAGRRPRGLVSPSAAKTYIGVLVDDLITRGAPEPYRMFTSRAEYRLSLREDNADTRLSAQGRELGLIDDARWAFFERKRDAVDAELARLSAAVVRTSDASRCRAAVAAGPASHPRDPRHRIAAPPRDLLPRPASAWRRSDAARKATDWQRGRAAVPEQVSLQVDVQAKYSGYLKRQNEEIDRQLRHEELRLPPELDYAEVSGLSNEARQRLRDVRPATLGPSRPHSGPDPRRGFIVVGPSQEARPRRVSPRAVSRRAPASRAR